MRAAVRFTKLNGPLPTWLITDEFGQERGRIRRYHHGAVVTMPGMDLGGVTLGKRGFDNVNEAKAFARKRLSPEWNQ